MLIQVLTHHPGPVVIYVYSSFYTKFIIFWGGSNSSHKTIKLLDTAFKGQSVCDLEKNLQVVMFLRFCPCPCPAE